MKYEDLAFEAKKAMENAYSPYSHFSVGAALLCRSGKVYTGCNIENASYTPTVCAERVAFFKALSDGEREFEAIAIAGGANGNVSAETAPCGVCRQVMSEFCGAISRSYLFPDRRNGNLPSVSFSRLHLRLTEGKTEVTGCENV